MSAGKISSNATTPADDDEKFSMHAFNPPPRNSIMSMHVMQDGKMVAMLETPREGHEGRPNSVSDVNDGSSARKNRVMIVDTTEEDSEDMPVQRRGSAGSSQSNVSHASVRVQSPLTTPPATAPQTAPQPMSALTPSQTAQPSAAPHSDPHATPILPPLDLPPRAPQMPSSLPSTAFPTESSLTSDSSYLSNLILTMRKSLVRLFKCQDALFYTTEANRARLVESYNQILNELMDHVNILDSRQQFFIEKLLLYSQHMKEKDELLVQRGKREEFEVRRMRRLMEAERDKARRICDIIEGEVLGALETFGENKSTNDPVDLTTPAPSPARMMQQMEQQIVAVRERLRSLVHGTENVGDQSLRRKLDDSTTVNNRYAQMERSNLSTVQNTRQVLSTMYDEALIEMIKVKLSEVEFKKIEQLLKEELVKKEDYLEQGGEKTFLTETNVDDESGDGGGEGANSSVPADSSHSSAPAPEPVPPITHEDKHMQTDPELIKFLDQVNSDSIALIYEIGIQTEPVVEKKPKEKKDKTPRPDRVPVDFSKPVEEKLPAAVKSNTEAKRKKSTQNGTTTAKPPPPQTQPHKRRRSSVVVADAGATVKGGPSKKKEPTKVDEVSAEVQKSSEVLTAFRPEPTREEDTPKDFINFVDKTEEVAQHRKRLEEGGKEQEQELVEKTASPPQPTVNAMQPPTPIQTIRSKTKANSSLDSPSRTRRKLEAALETAHETAMESVQEAAMESAIDATHETAQETAMETATDTTQETALENHHKPKPSPTTNTAHLEPTQHDTTTPRPNTSSPTKPPRSKKKKQFSKSNHIPQEPPSPPSRDSTPQKTPKSSTKKRPKKFKQFSTKKPASKQSFGRPSDSHVAPLDFVDDLERDTFSSWTDDHARLQLLEQDELDMDQSEIGSRPESRTSSQSGSSAQVLPKRKHHSTNTTPSRGGGNIGNTSSSTSSAPTTAHRTRSRAHLQHTGAGGEHNNPRTAQAFSAIQLDRIIDKLIADSAVGKKEGKSLVILEGLFDKISSCLHNRAKQERVQLSQGLLGAVGGLVEESLVEEKVVVESEAHARSGSSLEAMVIAGTGIGEGVYSNAVDIESPRVSKEKKAAAVVERASPIAERPSPIVERPPPKRKLHTSTSRRRHLRGLGTLREQAERAQTAAQNGRPLLLDRKEGNEKDKGSAILSPAALEVSPAPPPTPTLHTHIIPSPTPEQPLLIGTSDDDDDYQTLTTDENAPNVTAPHHRKASLPLHILPREDSSIQFLFNQASKIVHHTTYSARYKLRDENTSDSFAASPNADASRGVTHSPFHGLDMPIVETTLGAAPSDTDRFIHRAASMQQLLYTPYATVNQRHATPTPDPNNRPPPAPSRPTQMAVHTFSFTEHHRDTTPLQPKNIAPTPTEMPLTTEISTPRLRKKYLQLRGKEKTFIESYKMRRHSLQQDALMDQHANKLPKLGLNERSYSSPQQGDGV